MRLAVLADIHGNLPALEAVLADIRHRGIDQIVNLGDCVSGPLWPAETVALLRQTDWPTVRGNHDRLVGEGDTRCLGASDLFAAERLTEADRRWLDTRPTSLAHEGRIVAFHARPDRDDAYLIEDQIGSTLQRAAPDIIAARLGALDAAVILTAHSHCAASLRLPDGRWVLNPGSVGCPAYDDDSTVPPHVSETGCPSARYAILDLSTTAPMIALLSIPYRHDHAAAQAEAAGRLDWAQALRTGYAQQVQP